MYDYIDDMQLGIQEDIFTDDKETLINNEKTENSLKGNQVSTNEKEIELKKEEEMDPLELVIKRIEKRFPKEFEEYRKKSQDLCQEI